MEFEHYRIGSFLHSTAIEFKFEPRDLWVGIYWKYWKSRYYKNHVLDLYICILPTMLIHIEHKWNYIEGQPNQEEK